MPLKNRYRLIELIAQGGFGKTFLAVDEVQYPPLSCVIKVFWLQNQDKIELEQTLSIFEREVGKLKELGKHPQIPALLDFFEEDGKFCLVQELIDGMNLAKIVEVEGVFDESQVWHLLNNLLPVLRFIHERNVIHGDIKPANIIRIGKKAEPWGMRSQAEPGNEKKKAEPGNEKWVLVDFGVEFFSGGSRGSAEYVAPEQLGGNAVFGSDLYSLGVSCFYLLTGVSPFNLSAGIWREYLPEEISDRFYYILDKLLQNDPKQRFQSADKVLQLMGNKSKILHPKSKIQKYSCCHTLTGHGGLFSGVNSVAISPDNQILASGSDDKTIRLWNVETGEVKATLLGHTNFVQSVAFSPDGTILASGSDDKTIKLWDLQTYEEICTLSEHSRAVKSVTFSPDGQFLASGCWDKTIKLWDLKSKKVICSMAGHQLQVTSVTFSPDGRYLASASFDRMVRLWDLQNLELLSYQILSGHCWPVFSVAFSPKGDMLATGSGDNTIKLWDLKTGQEIRSLLGHSWSVVAVAFSPDGETLISGSWDQTVKLWQVSTGKEIDTLAGHLDAVTAVGFSHNGQIIASGSKDKTIKLWRREG